MKLRFLQLSVLLVGCLGLLFVCFPNCLASFQGKECEKMHFRTVQVNHAEIMPVMIDTSFTIRDSMINKI